MLKKIALFLLFLFFLNYLPAHGNTIKILTIDNYIINPVIEEYIKDGINKAEEDNSLALIIRLNTHGGLLIPTQSIVKDILNAKVPVITYVWPKGARAASAGTFIGYASSILVMAPSTHIGAAHPVLGQGSWGTVPEEMKNKLMNDTLAWAKNIAEEKGIAGSITNEGDYLIIQTSKDTGLTLLEWSIIVNKLAWQSAS
jgi:membrane-bound serine protease (ClpP class)